MRLREMHIGRQQGACRRRILQSLCPSARIFLFEIMINRRVPIASPRYPFKTGNILGAPDDPGVYALYVEEELIFFGHANGGATIQTRWRSHGKRATMRGRSAVIRSRGRGS
jgi:hypothetical protein